MVQKVKAFRSKKYLAWVKTLPCVDCGAPADDPHHAIGIGLGVSGMGMTAPDSLAMPMCRGCHTRMHNDPKMWEMQLLWIVKTLMAAMDEGILCIR